MSEVAQIAEFVGIVCVVAGGLLVTTVAVTASLWLMIEAWGKIRGAQLDDREWRRFQAWQSQVIARGMRDE